MTPTRSQFLAMSLPQAAAAPQEPESPESIPSQGSPLSPYWIHAITNLRDKGSRNGSSVKLSLFALTLASHGIL